MDPLGTLCERPPFTLYPRKGPGGVFPYSQQGDHEKAIAALRTAIELNPSEADAYSVFGFALARAGRWEDAIEALETGMRLSPHSPILGAYLNLIANSLVMLNRYEEAAEPARKAIQAFDARVSETTTSGSDAVPFWTYAHLASALGHLGRGDEAKAALEEMLRRKPDFSRDFIMRVVGLTNPDDSDLWFEGLRKAGWRE